MTDTEAMKHWQKRADMYRDERDKLIAELAQKAEQYGKETDARLLVISQLRAEVENLRKHAADDHDNIRLIMAQRDEARAEVERLKAGGCARDQKTTQFCFEAMQLAQQLTEARADAERLKACLQNSDSTIRALAEALESLEQADVQTAERILQRAAHDALKGRS